jgi:hypothetical protein
MKSTFLIAFLEQVLYAYINFKSGVGEIALPLGSGRRGLIARKRGEMATYNKIYDGVHVFPPRNLEYVQILSSFKVNVSGRYTDEHGTSASFFHCVSFFSKAITFH